MADPGSRAEPVRDARLARMKLLATGLLGLAAAVYAAAEILQPRYPWLYYVAAAAEAAMIGAIADWFAVVALFHHPLGLRFIPHTAILPRNKARVAAGLSEFIQQNFLTTQAVVERIAEFRPAQTLCRWLLKPENAEALGGYGARLLAFGVEALDDERVRRFLHQAADAALRRADVASAAAQVLDVLTENRRHHALLDAALAALDELLAKEETRRYIAAEVAQNAPALLRAVNRVFSLELDGKAAVRIVEVLIRKIGEVRRDRDHELRARFDAYVAAFIARLKDDEGLRVKVQRLRDEALENPALGRYVGELWAQFRGWLSADLARDDSATRRRLAELARGFGARIEGDVAIQRWIDEQILAAAPRLVAEHRARIGRFVEDQINGWHEERLVAELERHIGPDLQYIRINGTVVGALAGLAIAVLTQALK